MVVVFFGALLARMGYFNMDKQRVIIFVDQLIETNKICIPSGYPS